MLFRSYIRIGLWSVAPAVVCAGLTGFFNGIRRPGLSLIAVLASLAINVVGNYALIFGNWGFPEMGIKGAAIATVAAWTLRMTILTGALPLPEKSGERAGGAGRAPGRRIRGRSRPT